MAHSPKNAPTGSDGSPLLRLEDAEALGVDEVLGLYRDFVNPGQAEIFSTFGFGQTLFSRAKGMYMTTVDGREILDFTGGFGVLSHGHNHSRILDARIRFQQRERMEVHKVVVSPYLAALSHNIATLLPAGLNKCFLPNSGAEAVEGALKATHKFHGGTRKHVLHSDISFHGKLIASGAISGSNGDADQFPEFPNTRAFAYNDLASVEEAVRELRTAGGACDVYALIVEPYNASSMTGATTAFLQGLRAICDRESIMLIFDEVFTGWGKSGSLFAFLEHGVNPDALTMSKALGGGKSSISCLVLDDRLFDGAYGKTGDALLHTSTYNGFGEECATAIEAINIVVEDDYPARARHIHERLNGGLQALQARFPDAIREVRGRGAINGIVLRTPLEALQNAVAGLPLKAIRDKRGFVNKITTAAVVDEMFAQHGILVAISENRDLVILSAAPSLIVTDAEIDRFLDSLGETLSRGLKSLSLRFVANGLRHRMTTPNETS